MRNEYKAMDSDMRAVEPCDLWQKHIDKNYLAPPVGSNRHQRDLGVQILGNINPVAAGAESGAQTDPRPIDGAIGLAYMLLTIVQFKVPSIS